MGSARGAGAGWALGQRLRAKEPVADPAPVSDPGTFPGGFLPIADLTWVKDPFSRRLQGHIQLPSQL